MSVIEAIAHSALLPLRKRNFRLFFVGQSLSLLGTWVHTTAQRWLLFELTNSAISLGVLGAIGSLPILLFSLPAGYLADRLPKRKLLLLAQTIAASQAFILGMLVLEHVVKPWHIFALAFVLGTSVALEFPVRHSFIYELVGKEPLIAALSLHSTAFNLARFSGPALAGFLMGTFGIATCFFFNAFSYVPLLCILASMNINQGTTSAKRPWEGIQEVFTFVKDNPSIKATLLLIATTSVFLLPYAILLPVLARKVYGVGAQGFSFLMAINGLGALCGALFMASVGQRLPRRKSILAHLLALSFFLGLTALTHRFSVASIGLLAAGFHMVCTFTFANAHLQINSSDELRGRVLSLFSLSFLGLFPFGSLLSGFLAQHFGVQTTLLIGSSIGILMVTVLFIRGFGRRF